MQSISPFWSDRQLQKSLTIIFALGTLLSTHILLLFFCCFLFDVLWFFIPLFFLFLFLFRNRNSSCICAQIFIIFFLILILFWNLLSLFRFVALFLEICVSIQICSVFSIVFNCFLGNLTLFLHYFAALHLGLFDSLICYLRNLLYFRGNFLNNETRFRIATF